MPFLKSTTIEKFKKLGMNIPSRYLKVDIPSQTMRLIDGDTIIREYYVSTSRYGVGNRVGSNQTPRGIHRIKEKYGHGAPKGRIFRSREDTGEDWRESLTDDNCILSRILWLEGLEEGVNRGPGIDTYDRYIYIHGTNNEQLVGTPNSHGCINMKNDDVIDLFELVGEGTIVIID
ncbi:MAG: L,D-transpeptidase family protein [Chitinivibrionales bacterium]|nr:L,D-transpeptidase family protein [Chitinivibrionales bacterium]